MNAFIWSLNEFFWFLTFFNKIFAKFNVLSRDYNLIIFDKAELGYIVFVSVVLAEIEARMNR